MPDKPRGAKPTDKPTPEKMPKIDETDADKKEPDEERDREDTWMWGE